MKQKTRNQELENRENKIIEFIKDNPYCSRDKIFTKGKIPKSKATVELINKLISQKKINETGTIKKKYYVDEIDFIKHLEIIIKEWEDSTKNNSKYNNKVNNKALEFLKIRTKVLKAEEKIKPDLNIEDTQDIFFNYIIPYQKNPSKLFEINLLDILNWAIKDDKYYLKHQLHSNPKETEHKFQKTKKRHVRRSIENLLDMKKQGRYEYGLREKDFKKNMEKMTNDPSVWMDRFYSEKERTLYENTLETELKIRKEALDSIKLTPDMPNYDLRKKLIDVERKFFPDYPVGKIMQILIDDKVEGPYLRNFFEENDIEFDLEKIKKIGPIRFPYNKK